MKRILTAVLLTLSATLAAQERAIRPLDVPMSFSGTYGELRHDHFHGGLDWRTGGRTGDPIHSIKSGYVKQVTVSPGGYGNGIYVQHPDGTLSVYGHMSAFPAEIAARIREEQYARESFSVSLQFSEEEFPVEQGDVIGYVGNTGSSAGPHLHMEVRDGENVPLNYIALGYYKPVDHLSPIFRRVAFYAYDTLAVARPYRIHMIYNPSGRKEPVLLPPVSYVAVDAVDLQDGTTGKLAVEEYSVILDRQQIFHLKLGDIGFEEGRHIKSLVQHGERGADMVKSVVDPANMLAFKTDTLSGGLIRLNDDRLHNLRLEATDEHGNRSVVSLQVRRGGSFREPRQDTTFNLCNLLWYQPGFICADGISFTLPPASLFGNARAEWKRLGEAEPEEGIYSPVWQISGGNAPLRCAGLLKIAHTVPPEKREKAYVAKPGFGYAGALDGAKVGWGTYFVAIDEEDPEITIDRRGRIRVRDAKSGVSGVRVLVDGKWHLSIFKSGTVRILDRKNIGRGPHKVVIEASDIMGNTARLEKTMTF